MQKSKLKDIPESELTAFIILLTKTCQKVTRSNTETIEDLTQDILLKMIDRDLPMPQYPAAFTYTVARNTWIHKKRRQKSEQKACEYLKNHSEIFFEVKDNGYQARLRSLYELIDELPSKQKEIVYERISGKTHKEIAELLGIPEPTVRGRYLRATRKMKERAKKERLITSQQF